MKVGIYVRVSTTMQVDRDSLKTQEERLRLYCKAQGFEIYKDRIYRDEGISAKDIKRPGFESLMRDVEAGRIQAIVVTRLDRVTRSLKDLINLMESLQQHNVKLISLTENIDTTGPMGRFIINLLGSIAQLEREIDSERVSADMHHRALSGKWTGGVVPLGYTTRGKLMKQFMQKGMKEDEALREANKITPEKGRLYVADKEARLVKKIHNLYLDLRSLRRVTHELNKQRIKTPEGQTWAMTSIRRILTNPTYIGKIWYGKRKTDLSTGRLKKVKEELWKVVKGEHEPVVSPELFGRVQKLLEQKSRKPTRAQQTYLLSGLVRCGLCRGSMFGYIYFKKKYSRQYYYYRCHNSVSKGSSVCKGQVVPAQVIEKKIIETLLNMSKNEKFLHDKELMLKALLQESGAEKPDINEEKKKLVLEEKQLLDKRDVLLEKLESRVIDDATFIDRFDRIKKDLDVVRDRQVELAGKGESINLQEIALKTSFDELCNLQKIWPLLKDEEKNEKLKTIVNQIIIDYDKPRHRINLKVELFLDSSNLRKKDKFHFVVVPYRRGRDS